MKKTLKAIINFFALIMGVNNEATKQAVDAGILDLSGQGRDKYGK